MPPLPWKTLTIPNRGKEYVALLSFLPLKHYRTIPLFFWLTFKTQQQLKRAKGLIGYSLQAEPRGDGSGHYRRGKISSR